MTAPREGRRIARSRGGEATKRRAAIIVMWIAIAIGASSALSCMRVVDLDAPGGLPDAGFGFPDGAGDSAPIQDGGLDIEDGSTIGDAFVPDAP